MRVAISLLSAYNTLTGVCRLSMNLLSLQYCHLLVNLLPVSLIVLRGQCQASYDVNMNSDGIRHVSVDTSCHLTGSVPRVV